MAQKKTYPQLQVQTTVADSDLMATYRGSGPLKQITAGLVKDYMIGDVVGSGLTFGPFTGDGSDTTFTMAQTVDNGSEFTVEVFVAGVRQFPGDDYTCDGTTTLTFTTSPETGAIIEGVHAGSSNGNNANDQTPYIVETNGRLATSATRFGRMLDIADAPNIYKNGVTDDGPGIVAAYASGPVRTHASGILRILTNTTIPAGTLTKIVAGQFYVAAGITLRIDGAFQARRTAQIFTGPGTVLGLDDVSPEMFGAVGNWDDTQPDGGAYTDDTDAFNKAVACVLACGAVEGATRLPRVKALDKAYGLDSQIIIQPSLTEVIEFCGTGWSLIGTGTRFYSSNAGGGIKVLGRFAIDDINCNSEWKLHGFTVLPSDNPFTIGIDIDGGGTSDNFILTGLNSNVIENVTCSDFATNISIKSVTKLDVRKCYFNSTTVYGRSMYIGVSAGGSDTSEIIIDSVVFGQPVAGGAGGGNCLYIECSEVGVGSPALAGVKAVNVMGDTQFYAGHAGRCVVMTCKGAPGKGRTLGDMTFAPGTKFQGNATFTTTNALYVEAIDGGEISSIKVLGCQLESCLGSAIDIRILTTGAVFGKIHDVQIQANHFRYHVNRSVYADGVKALEVLNNNLPYCGTGAATATRHMEFVNCFGRAENNLVSAKDALWVGLANGYFVNGGSTKNFRTRNNAMGITTKGSYDASVTDVNSGDSADQPSLTVQV